MAKTQDGSADQPDFAARLARRIPELAGLTDPNRIVLLLADTLACAIAAEALSAGGNNIVARTGQLDAGSAEGATIWATGESASLEAAALRNGVAARYLDFNDTYVGKVIVHPSDMIAAIVALAETRRVEWTRLIEAVSVAYDVLCLMSDQAETRRNGWDPATLVPLAIAAGCAHLLGFEATRAADAIRLAALDSATLRCIRLGKIADWKAVASARNAVKGLFAVQMAELGTEGPPVTFEGEDGFFARISGTMQIDDVPVSRVAAILTKRFSAQIFIQSFLELAEDLHAELGGRAGQITSVTIGACDQAIRMVGPRPGHHKLNRETADHSAAFCVAAMLIKGRFGHEDVDTYLEDEAVLALAGRVEMTEAEGADYPTRLPATLSVTLADGTAISRRLDHQSPPDIGGFARKLDDLWTPGRDRAWAWNCRGTAPMFPTASQG